MAFYDALETNQRGEGAGDETLRDIARELVKTVRANVTIDWTVRENIRAQLRVVVKRILRKYGYPPIKLNRKRRHRPCWSRQKCFQSSGLRRYPFPVPHFLSPASPRRTDTIDGLAMLQRSGARADKASNLLPGLSLRGCANAHPLCFQRDPDYKSMTPSFPTCLD